MRKNVLDLDYKKANEFFLDQKSYITLELPPYFYFEAISLVSKKLGGRLSNETELNKAKNADGVNHVIYSNKDGKYAWRKLQLINPCLYVYLVNLISDPSSWQLICTRLNSFRKSKSIVCASMPVLRDPKMTQKASQVNEWVESVERESIKYALDFEYLLQTDISDCYASIYTHTIAWALHGKSVSKKKRRYKDLLGNKIDWHLQAMSHGQTNGIPQGSVLMDFIAEIVLAYADDELLKKIKRNLKIRASDYRVLRYRDDYRIFVRESNTGEFIIKALSETLAELGMNLNTAKTIKSEKVVLDSIKPDKISSFHDYSPKKLDPYEIRDELLKIHELGTKYPNSGSIKRLLNDIDEYADHKLFQKHPEESISILASIVFDSPSSIYIASALISKALENLSKSRKKITLKKISRKFGLLPNSGHLEVWLQRMAVPYKIKNGYREKLCKCVEDSKAAIFNSNWITSNALKETVRKSKIIDKARLRNINTSITRKEVELFPSGY